jgi:hypothetical protein
MLTIMFFYRIFDLKAALYSLTNVPPERQKILGLVKGKLPPDQERMYVNIFCTVNAVLCLVRY